MFKTGKQFFSQMKNLFGRSSTPMSSRNLLHLGAIEETDLLGTALHKEAATGNSKTLKKILNTAICVDYPNDLGQTPLFCACARDNESTALLLLQWKANPNERSMDGMTPCHAASFMGNVHLLGKLIEAGGDLRLHDNNGNSVKDWAFQNFNSRKKLKMLEFIDETHMSAMAYSGDTDSLQMSTKYYGRSHQQTSLMEIVTMKTGSDLTLENIKQVQSTGFGKVYLGNGFNSGIISVVPLVSEATLLVTDGKKYDTGFYTYIERMQWLNESVSVKQVKTDVEIEDGIDLLIADAEYLGKLRHPKILLLMGISQSAYLDRMMLVFEHVENATLHFLLHQTTRCLLYHESISIVHQICSAMDFIHSKNLIHCGLSSMAIYLVSSHTTKVGNFEFMVESIKADLGKPSPVSLVSHGEFLYNWMSPELIQGLALTTALMFTAIVASFGRCFLVGEIPWANLKPEIIRKKVVDDGIPLNINIPKLPLKLQTIIGYGLELREECRLNKFSSINEWLKSFQQPASQRTNTPQHLKDRSCNFADTQHWSSSSCASSLSMKNELNASCQETYAQDRLDFNKDSQNNTLTTKTSEKFHLSPSTLAAKSSNLSVKSLRGRKCPSESDLKYENQGLQLIKPASHLRCLNSGDLHLSGYNGCEFHLLEKNNSGNSSQAKDAALSEDNTLQSLLGNTDESTNMLSSCENVRRQAYAYQLRLNQHKLRQAILRGSMSPRGSCPDLETSSDSVVSTINRKVNENKLPTCKDTDTAVQICHLQCSTPNERLISIGTEQQHVSDSTVSDFPKIFYTMKASRDVCTCCSSKDLEEDNYKNNSQHFLIEDEKCHKDKAFREDVTINTKEDFPQIHGETMSNDSSFTHREFLKEIRTAHMKLVNRSLGATDTQSSTGIYVDTYFPKLRTKYESLLSNCNSPDMNVAQGEIDKVHTNSSQNLKSQSCRSFHENTKLKDLNYILHDRTEVEGIDSDLKRSGKTSKVSRRRAVNFHLVKADVTENKKLVLDFNELGQPSVDRCELVKELDTCNDFVYQTGDRYDHQEHTLATPETFQDKQITVLVHKGNKKHIDIEHNKCKMKTVLNDTFIMVPESKPVDIISCHTMDSACSTQNTSVDSDRIEKWVNIELDKIKEKMRHKSSCIVSDNGTESSGSLHRFQDISSASTLEEGGIKTVKNCAIHIPDCNGLELSRHFEKNKTVSQNIASTKTSSEVDGSCDFEFREFYIDDEFDSAEHIQQDVSSSKLFILNCNTSTRHTTDDISVATVIESKAKNTEDYFLHVMANVQPSVFPSRPVDTSLGNFLQSTLNVDNTEIKEVKKIAVKLEKNIFIKKKGAFNSFESMHGLSKEVPTSKTGGVSLRPKTTSTLERQQDGSHQNTIMSSEIERNRHDKKEVGDFEQCSVMINEDLKYDTDQKIVSGTHQLISTSKAHRARNMDEPCISVEKTQTSDDTTDLFQTAIARKDYKTVLIDGSDSDSDQWVRNKVISVQEKIRRRRARMIYSISSDESSDDIQCHQSPVTTKDTSSNEETFTQGYNENFQAEGCVQSLNSDHDRYPSHSSKEKIMNSSKGKSTMKQNINECHASTRERSCDQEKEDSKIAKSSYLNMKSHTGSRSKLTNHFSRTNTDIISAVKCHTENKGETTSKMKDCPEKAKVSDLQASNSISSSKTQNVSKMSELISVFCTNTSKTNIESNGSHKSVNQSGTSLNKYKLWKSDRKDKKPPSHGCNITSQECSKNKSHRSILRRPNNLTAKISNTKINNAISSIPFPVQLSRSKFSVDNDSKLSDKVISFQGITDNEDSKSYLEQVPLSSQQSSSINEITLQEEESFGSFDFDKKFVKTWLDRENFAERCSLASLRQVDCQSITSRVMKVPKLSSRQTDIPSQISVPTYPYAENSSHHLNKFGIAAKEGTSYTHENCITNITSPCEGNLTPSYVRTENALEEKSASLSYIPDDHFVHDKACHNVFKSTSQKQFLDRGLSTRSILQMNQNNDHCLTLDLSTPGSENDTGSTSSLKDSKKQPHIGLHRFYIPHEMYHEGCTARMSVQISRTHPVSHRVITTTTDPVSGQTETLLDHSIVTHNLRSTMQLD